MVDWVWTHIQTGTSHIAGMLRVDVAFPSGSGETLTLPDHSKVGDLKLLAQQTFGKGFLKLITVEGHVLTNLKESLQAAGVKDGERLTAVAQQVQVAASRKAFAVWCSGGNQVVSWGNHLFGGDCSVVQDQLQNVLQIQATHHALAAILTDGSVVAWCHPEDGGDCSAVQDQLRNVQQVSATADAFAAILVDGSVITWGDPDHGGDCSAVQDQLRNVRQVQAADTAFAAILVDGSVVCWGDRNHGGDCFAVQDQLRNVQQIQATTSAFAAFLIVGLWAFPIVCQSNSVKRCRRLKPICKLTLEDSIFLLSFTRGPSLPTRCFVPFAWLQCPMIHNWGYTFFLNCALVLCRVLSSPEPCTSQAQVNMADAHFDPQCLMPTGSKTRYPPVQPAQSRFASWCRFFAMCFRRHRTCCRHTPPSGP